MPDRKTMERAAEDKREGKAPTTQAGEFVREEMHHIREGKHGAQSTKQAIAIGLSKARRAGVKLPPPKEGTVSERTRESAKRAVAAGAHGPKPASPRPMSPSSVVTSTSTEPDPGSDWSASRIGRGLGARSWTRVSMEVTFIGLTLSSRATRCGCH